MRSKYQGLKSDREVEDPTTTSRGQDFEWWESPKAGQGRQYTLTVSFISKSLEGVDGRGGEETIGVWVGVEKGSGSKVSVWWVGTTLNEEGIDDVVVGEKTWKRIKGSREGRERGRRGDR